MAGRTSSIRAGRAFFELFADDSRLVRGLRGAEQKIKATATRITQIGATIFAAGAAVTGTLFGSAKQFAAVGDQIHKMQSRTGFAAEALSALGFASEQSGASIDQLDRSLAAMARFSLQVERGLATATDVLDLLGVSVQEFNAAKPEDRFLLLAEAISQVDDPTKRAGLALQIFGRSGRELLPLLAEGKDGITALMQEAEDLGITLTDADAKAAAELTDAMNVLKRSLGGIVTQIGAAVAPVIVEMLETVKPVITAVIEWVKNNRELVATVFKVAAAVTAVGAVVTAASVALGGAGAVLGGIVSGFLALKAIVLGAIAAFKVLAIPILVATVAITALGAGLFVFFKHTETGQRALDALRKKFHEVIGFAKEFGGALFKAFQAGRLDLVGDLLKKAFDAGFAFVKLKAVETWNFIKNFASDAWDVIVNGLSKALTIAFGALEKSWVTVIAALKSHWDKFVFGILGSEVVKKLFPELVPDAQDKVAIEAQRQADIAGIDQRTAAALAVLDDDLADKINKRDREADEREQKLRANFEKLNKELQDLIDTVNGTEFGLAKVGDAAGGVTVKKNGDITLPTGGTISPSKSVDAFEFGDAATQKLLVNALGGGLGKSAADKQLEKTETLIKEVKNLGKAILKAKPKLGTV